MRYLFLITALALGSVAMAEEAPCPPAEYMQLKIGDRAELREEYCIALGKAQSKDRIHKIIQEGIAKKQAIPADTSQDEKDSLAALGAAGSCRVRAAQFEVALSKRFKSKPPKSCD